jgi:acyl dehydratase
MIVKPFDELQIGETYTSRGRTITETDVVNFCALTGNWIEVHSNIEFCKNHEFGQRLVQGSLTYAIATGLITWDHELIVSNYGLDRLRYLKPVFINDTVHVVAEIVEKQEKDENRGVVAIQVKIYNQRNEMVQTSTFKLLVRRKRLVA